MSERVKRTRPLEKGKKKKSFMSVRGRVNAQRRKRQSQLLVRACKEAGLDLIKLTNLAWKL